MSDTIRQNAAATQDLLYCVTPLTPNLTSILAGVIERQQAILDALDEALRTDSKMNVIVYDPPRAEAQP